MNHKAPRGLHLLAIMLIAMVAGKAWAPIAHFLQFCGFQAIRDLSYVDQTLLNDSVGVTLGVLCWHLFLAWTHEKDISFPRTPLLQLGWFFLFYLFPLWFMSHVAKLEYRGYEPKSVVAGAICIFLGSYLLFLIFRLVRTRFFGRRSSGMSGA